MINDPRMTQINRDNAEWRQVSTEYGLFSDEGCVEAQFYSIGEAAEAILDRYTEDDGLTIAVVCTEHEGERADACEHCYTEDGS